LVDVRTAEIRAGAMEIWADSTFDPANGGPRVKQHGSTYTQPHVFAAVPIGPDAALGVGVYSPFGQSTDWPVTSGFAGLATFNEIKYVTGAIGGAYRLGAVSIGASLEYSRASVDLNRLTPLAPGVVSHFGYKGNDTAMSGNVGVKWHLSNEHTLGIMYQRKTDFSFNGTAALDGVTSAPGSAGWVFPDNLAIGWQWEFAPTWQAEVAYDRTFWNKLRTVSLQAGPLSTALPLNWKTSGYYNVGIEHRFSDEFRAAAGYSFSENSIPDANFTPALPDVDRHLWNVGAFWHRGRIDVGVVVQRGLSPSHTIAGPQPDGLGGSAAGTYRSNLWAADATIAVSF